MATFEERLTAIEREHAELKEKVELQTIAIGALVSKATLEKLNEKYDKLFDSLIAHDRLTNERLGDLQTQVIELDGKIVGLQTEMRQRFDAVNSRFETIDGRFDAVNNHFETLEQGMNSRFDQITLLLSALGPKPEQEK